MAQTHLTGGCQCGAVRYAVTAPPRALYCCHCANCQRQGGSAFAMSLLIDADAFEVTQGAPAVYRFSGDSGRRKEGLYCADCGVRLSHVTEGAETRTVRAGTLDDAIGLEPAGHIWTQSAQGWVRFPDDDLLYERGPDDGFAALTARWRTMQNG